MARRRPRDPIPQAMLFVDALRRRHSHLFLPKLLRDEADRPAFHAPDVSTARQMLLRWADLAEAGHLNQKETTLDAEFLEKIFGDALGYRAVTETPQEYHRQKQFTVPGAGTADGALGIFRSGHPDSPVAVIELKGAQTDLDHDRSGGGRTPVQQLWDYLRELPDCPWGILSNYITIRLYHRNRTSRSYEEFLVTDFRDEARFRQFYYIFERGGLLGTRVTSPRALALLDRSQRRQREVGDDLYDAYSTQRLQLIHHLVREQRFDETQAIQAAQKILDRIVFIAFCEDRALMPEGLIARAFSQVPPFARVTNPRWQNFKGLFAAVDQGDDANGVPAYNGGLFRDDPAVDNLELDDRWTNFFREVSTFDFRDEVNVDVLGHLFERSVTELEKLRIVGLFGRRPGGEGPAMPKSAQRKRFGIYYTPPQFTELIVENTIGELIRQRVETLSDPLERIAALRRLRVCDPACGSGAFLIAAFDRLEASYEDAVRLLQIEGREEEASGLARDVPDWILADNLYGVDLSEESIEITQLALWIRSARKGRKLSDLSQNIRCGNSLVCDPQCHPRAFVWAEMFPQIFTGDEPGFDAVIGNPPWERMKLQEREFFALGSPEIAAAVRAADRRRLIAQLEQGNAEMWQRYHAAKSAAEATLAYMRRCGEFPLTARGDVNTYMLFAELARKIVAPSGRVGLLVPSGIATDDTTKHFFADLIENGALIALYDFENKKGVFADVHRSFKFCVLLMNGSALRTQTADFVFFAHAIEDLEERDRHISLSPRDLKLLNPNTMTCPIFRNRRDAELTMAIYRRVPILLDENRQEGGNPWGVRFVRMFDQTNDAEHFRTAAELRDESFRPDGNRWVKRSEVYLPLYEAKMVQAFDHRAASVLVEQNNWMRQGQPEETSLVEHQNPEFCVLPRYWVAESTTRRALRSEPLGWFIGFKDITSATNQRTMIAAAIPWSAVTNHFPLLITPQSARLQMCLLGNLNSLIFDYVTRQKVGAVTLNFFIVEQLPTLPPDAYEERCRWHRRQTLEHWISQRVLKLTCTANDMIPLAQAAGFDPPVYRWREQERAELRAELDAAFFILYGIDRPDVEYMLSTFQAIRDEDEAHDGAGPTRRLILRCFDNFSENLFL